MGQTLGNSGMSVVAETSIGKLEGERKNGICIFRGIPFAKPPIGPFRFRAPQPPESWNGIRQALRFGPACLQATNPFEDILPLNVGEVSEDCLYLNIWTPSLDGERPVMVWIHGGGFIAGAGSQPLYNGTSLSQGGDVVVVTLNYRLGVFGFLHGKTLCGDHLDTSGNEAILDQIAALQWVRNEIASFGGDPKNVTVFGQSAGSICIAALLGMPLAKGLFNKAILQSSGSAGQLITTEAASQVTAAILKETGLSPDKADKIRDLPAQELLRVQERVALGAGGFFPVIDGKILPRSTYESIRDGETEGIPILIGTTSDEQKLFNFVDPQAASLDEAGLLARIKSMVPGHGQDAINAYRTARTTRGESATPLEIWSVMVTDLVMRHPSMRFAELQAKLTPTTYAYLFTRKSPIKEGSLGAFHGSDLSFVFGLDNDPAYRAITGKGPVVDALSAKMQDAWLAFARTGDPSHKELPTWPSYEAKRRATMIFNEICEVEDAPREEERHFWETII